MMTKCLNYISSIYSFLSAGWGFISDVDIESEKLRWMGDTRYVSQANNTGQDLVRFPNLLM